MGAEILVARIGGQFYALSERCTHWGSPFSEGAMDIGVVTCPWHFAQFNLETGGCWSPSLRALGEIRSPIARGRSVSLAPKSYSDLITS